MTTTVTKPLFVNDLELSISGEVLSDPVSLGIYSTDASLYQITPLAVVLPKDDHDVHTAINIARDHRKPILPRGGGTSLAGQTVGEAIIIDFSKYMNRILEFNEKERWIRVQPGITRDQLNAFVSTYGLIFSPDPATSSRANIGGMVGNNSSGTKSILYGKTVDHVLEMRLLLASGLELHCRDYSQEELKNECQKDDEKGRLLSSFRKIIDDNKDEIRRRFPKVMRRVSGYNLDEFLDCENWNLSKVFCGSEGTLGVMLDIKLNLDQLPRHKSVCVAHFQNLENSLRAVQIAVGHDPAAVEILDRELLQLAKSNLYVSPLMHFIEGDPDNVLIIEFYGDDTSDIARRQNAMIAEFKAANYGYAFPIYPEGKTYENVWALRKKGLGILLGRKTEKKPLPFVEDSSVPVETLPEYILAVREICEKYRTEVAMYAHASVGVIHIRPILSMRDAEDIDKFKKISREVFELVKAYGGSWSGEHGDGLVRSYLLKDYFGDQVYEALRAVKSLFDPENLMNPGKIVDAQEDIAENLRYGLEYEDLEFETIYKYRDGGDFKSMVHLCSGVGECRKSGGTMCPSYHATMDEEHSTRGRANALRLAMSGQLADIDLSSDEIKDVLDLCLSCKACKSECPSNVDMAKLKSEVLQQHYDKRGASRRELFVKYSATTSKYFAGWLSFLINPVIQSRLFRWVLEKSGGIEKERTLPLYSSETFVSWAKRQARTNGPEVVLFADTYLNYHEPHIGKASFQLLSSLGYYVIVESLGCCQRPRISNGFLKSARGDGTKTANNIRKYLEQEIPVVICEPSCASALADDIPDLIENDDLARRMKKGVMPIESFISHEFPGLTLPVRNGHMILHGHCHQKTLYGTDIIISLLGQDRVDLIDAGCCGMAGAFGYEKEHYELSKKIGEQRLFKSIRENAGTPVIACGFSCRHQIKHFTGITAYHWVEMVDVSNMNDLNKLASQT
jgi:FAD/FMN-containing dehydrogenase/Fe-S oxidoreductase